MKRLAIVLTVMSFCGCTSRNVEELYPSPAGTTCDTTNITYSGTILPILKTNCAISGCHTGSSPANGYMLDDYATVQMVAMNGQLKGVITHSSTFDPMPQNAPMLDECTINKILHWINLGAPNN